MNEKRRNGRREGTGEEKERLGRRLEGTVREKKGDNEGA